ncbi:MAG: gamma-glutamyltransferase [Hyphomicrobiales bacterium]|nr:gamma-glutamyltransferase [Hyphomicrobiales bacterium]
MYPQPRSHRPLIMGRNGVVGANHPLAAQAGLDVLRAGGNAADASVAVSFALGVCEPMMSGLGGDGFYHIYMAKSGRAEVFNGTGPAPRAASPERYGSAIPLTGPWSISVPGSLAAICAMHAAHGRLPWPDLVMPAIALARHGFAATHTFRHFAAENEAGLAADERSRTRFLGHELAGLIRQPELARTLEEIATEGAQSFYRGRLAARLARGLVEAGTLLSEQDLADFEPQVQTPISVTYRGFEIRQTPPNSTGFVVLQMLKIIERFDVAALAPVERVHLLVEAKKRAFRDRETHGADPRFESVPVEHLLSDKQVGAHAGAIDLERAAELPLATQEAEGDTTYFCVIDAQGNAVSAIQSLNSAFGSGVTAGETGVLMNNRMAYWHLEGGHANRLMPGKRVRHTMNAPMIFKDGELWGVLGTPGGDNQVQVNIQVLVAMLDLGIDPQTAVELPRWTSSQSGQSANWPHDGDGALTIESDFGEELLGALERKGHRLNRVDHLGGPCAMQAMRLMPNGVRVAGSDTRRDGWALAY